MARFAPQEQAVRLHSVPPFTGSGEVSRTIGMVVVLDRSTIATASIPISTSGLSAINSSASAANRLFWPRAWRTSKRRLRPAT